jgi:opacity protein-like surface antigen
MTKTVRRALTIACLTLLMLGGRPAEAFADVTFFLGVSPTPEARPLRGFAGGVSLLLVGFEFDYAATSASEAAGAPSLRTGMINALLMTPTSTQLYLTAGAGFYRESLGGVGETNVGTNIGGGIKVKLLGPLQVRVDYRIFTLRGDALYKRPQRFYVGLNLPF